MLSAIAVVASVKMRPIRFPCLTTLMTAAAVVTTLILTTLNGVSSVTGEHQNGKRSSNESAAFSAVKSSRWPKLVDRHRRPRFVRETLLSTVYETFYHSDCVFIFFLLPVFFLDFFAFLFRSQPDDEPKFSRDIYTAAFQEHFPFQVFMSNS